MNDSFIAPSIYVNAFRLVVGMNLDTHDVCGTTDDIASKAPSSKSGRVTYLRYYAGLICDKRWPYLR